MLQRRREAIEQKKWAASRVRPTFLSTSRFGLEALLFARTPHGTLQAILPAGPGTGVADVARVGHRSSGLEKAISRIQYLAEVSERLLLPTNVHAWCQFTTTVNKGLNI